MPARRRARLVLAALLVPVLLLSAAPAGAQTVAGTAPSYTDRALDPLPNDQAVDRRFWPPGLNDGIVPQGITVAEGDVLMSGYRSTDRKVGSGPTRIYAIDPETGGVKGAFDLPAPFTHAGGIAYGGGGTLYVADTRLLGRFDLVRALKDGNAEAASQGTWPLAPPLRGSFMSFRDGAVWIGSWNPDGDGRMFAIPVAALKPGATLTEADATRSFAIGTRAQGAAFDPDGNLWISRSSSRIGELQKLDPKDGTVLARHDTAIGVEDLGFDREGRMWTVSEAGTQRWLHWEKYYPLLYRLDPRALK